MAQNGLKNDLKGLMQNFEYPVAVCDVLNKQKLEEYRKKRHEWLFLFDGDATHAIWHQIASMLWNDAVFRTVNEARRLSTGRKSSATNYPLAKFIDQGFVATQVLSIRKLLERPNSDPAKQVVSLRRVVDDVKNHRELITRENFVAYDGLPFDPQPAQNEFFRKIAEEHTNGIYSGWNPTSGPTAWSSSADAHAQFDYLSGTSPKDRSRADLIRPEIFDAIARILEESGGQDIVRFGHKFVAHAADEHSRSLLENPQGFSLNRLARCHEGICRAAYALYGGILYAGSYVLVPVPQFNQFENLDAPWASSEDIRKLDEFWREHVEGVDAWTQGKALV